LETGEDAMDATFQSLATKHAEVRARQRAIPPLVLLWLDEFGEEEYDGHGAIRTYFSRRSIRAMERAFGRDPIRRMAKYLDAYKVESANDGSIITVGHHTKRFWRR
jgi:hypothetical protein